MKKKISAGTLTRTAVLGLALANQLLSAAGKAIAAHIYGKQL